MLLEKKTSNFWPYFSLLAMAGFLYVQSLGFGWTYDDVPVVIENLDIRSFANFIENRYPGRPVRELSYMLDYSLFGINPAGYHLQQIFWHWVCAALIYYLFQALSVERIKAWGAALIFVVHPIQVETVASVGHRKECLALAFGLIALILYLKAIDSRSTRDRLKLIIASSVFYAIGLNTKQNIVLIPLVCMLYELKFVNNEKRLLSKSPTFNKGILTISLIGIFSWIFYLKNNSKFLANIYEIHSKLYIDGEFSVERYYYAVIKGAGFIFTKIFFPINLTPEYSYSVPMSFSDPWVILPVVVFLVLLCTLIFNVVKDKATYFAIILVLSFWLPVSNLFWYLSYPAADRYMYAPMAGMTYIFVKFLMVLVKDRKLNIALLGFLILFLSGLTLMQSSIWRDTYSLASRINEVYPHAEAGLIGLGSISLDENELDKALHYLEAALEVNPFNSTTYNNIGTVYYKKENFKEAAKYYEKAIEFGGDNSLAFVNMGSSYIKMGLFEKGIAAIEKGIKLNPLMVTGYQNLGLFYFWQSDFENGERVYYEGIKNNPNYPGLYFHLGKLFVVQKRYYEAINMFNEVIKITPEFPEPYQELLDIYILLKDEDMIKVQKTNLEKISKY